MPVERRITRNVFAYGEEPEEHQLRAAICLGER